MASRKKASARAAGKKKTAKPNKAARKPARKAAKTARAAKAPARKPKKAAPKKKQIVGEGDYAASRAFLKDQAGFVKKNKARIPALGKAAKAALEGSEGPALMAAEAEARGHAKTGSDEQ